MLLYCFVVNMPAYSCPKKMTDTGFYLAHEWRKMGDSLNCIAKRLKVSWRTVRDHLRHKTPPSARLAAHIPPRMNDAKKAMLARRRSLVSFYRSKKVVVERKHTNVRESKACDFNAKGISFLRFHRQEAGVAAQDRD